MISAKIMLLGDIGVGKTSLARRCVFDKFDADYKTTIGVDVLTHDTELGPECESEVLRLVLWDTDGDFGSRIFETVYLAGASGAIIVADASRPGTLVKMTTLADRFAEQLPGRPVVMIVNKIDLAGPCFEFWRASPARRALFQRQDRRRRLRAVPDIGRGGVAR